MKFDTLQPSKHNRGQKPQGITHNHRPEEFPWTQTDQKTVHWRGSAETPDLNRCATALCFR